jgi:hypothetical protein
MVSLNPYLYNFPSKESSLNLTFLAHDDQGNMRLIKRTTESDTPDVAAEWNDALEIWREKVPLLGELTLVGALTVTPDQRVRWYPDMDVDVSTDMIGRTLH